MTTLSYQSVEPKARLSVDFGKHQEPYRPYVWNRMELMPIDELRAIQFTRLRDFIRHCANSTFYRNRFKEGGLSAESVRCVEDIRKFPFTTKADLRDNHLFEFLAVPRDNVVRYHGSTGTTGKQTLVAYTHGDIEMWTECVARFLVAGGLKSHHTAQVAFGYGLFTGGFGLHFGLEKVGAAVIPASSGNTRRQLNLLQEMPVDCLVCTPSYAMKLAEEIEAEEIDRSKLSLEYGFLGSEPWTVEMRDTLDKTLGIFCTDSYGLSEVMGPGVSGDCMERTGLHIQEDLFIVECIDPDTLEPVPDGTPGELVITALKREAMPLLRYRTRDIAIIYSGECPCGRQTRRMSKVLGRSDDMLIIRGVNVFPSQVEAALLSIDGVVPHFQIVVERPKAMDEARVRVELTADLFSDKTSETSQIIARIEHTIQQVTGLHLPVELMPPQSLERFEGKAKRVLDNRNLR